LLKNQIMEWETLLEKLSWTFGIHQAFLVGVWCIRYVERDEASKKFLMAKSVRAVPTSLQIGSLTVDGFMLPDGLYRITQTKAAEAASLKPK
jgi:hypothetical protein